MTRFLNREEGPWAICKFYLSSLLNYILPKVKSQSICQWQISKKGWQKGTDSLPLFFSVKGPCIQGRFLSLPPTLTCIGRGVVYPSRSMVPPVSRRVRSSPTRSSKTTQRFYNVFVCQPKFLSFCKKIRLKILKMNHSIHDKINGLTP